MTPAQREASKAKRSGGMIPANIVGQTISCMREETSPCFTHCCALVSGTMFSPVEPPSLLLDNLIINSTYCIISLNTSQTGESTAPILCREDEKWSV